MQPVNLKRRLLDFYRVLPDDLQKLPIFIATSAGLDSSVLAHVTLTQRNALPPIHWLHVNYHLRVPDSDHEEKFLRDWAKLENVKLHVCSLHPPNKRTNIQLWARKKRYEFFHKVIKREKGGILWTAHHLRDQAETFLQRIIRGAGIKGLGGMRQLDEWPEFSSSPKWVFRPFLNIPHETILQYAEIHRVKYMEDCSNQTLLYQRNRIRQQILPLLIKENPRILENFAQLSLRFQEVQDLLMREADLWLEKYTRKKDKKILISALKDLSALKKVEVLSQWMRKEGIIQGQSRIYERILAYLQKPQGDLQIPLAQGMELRLSPKEIHLTNRMPIQPTLAKLDRVFQIDQLKSFNLSKINVEVQLAVRSISKIKRIKQKKPYLAYLDLAQSSLPLTLRFVEKGDRFMPLGTPHLKSVRRFLMDQKVPKENRHVPILLNSKGMVLWLIGHRIDHRARVHETSQKALEIRWITRNHRTKNTAKIKRKNQA